MTEDALVTPNRLATLTGCTSRTVARRLAGLAPVRETSRSKLYNAREALLRVLGPETRQRVAEAAAHPSVDAVAQVRALRCSGLGAELTLPELAAQFGVAAEDALLWTRFGCPYLQRGRRDGIGWRFHAGHVIRWLALMGAYLEARDLIPRGDLDLTPVLRAIDESGAAA